ncbi:MAG: hypothetical protein JSR80_06310 [Verrucomicrobia bacterium]|nr:hypothetical protein [Verrucomicrobiota bacterium]
MRLLWMLAPLVLLSSCMEQAGLGHRSYFLTQTVEVKAVEKAPLAVEDPPLIDEL